MTFKLAWKLLKDYQQEQGVIIKSPRDTIKKAFQTQLITDGKTCLEALKDRNLIVHTYQEESALEVEQNIKKFYSPLLEFLHQEFSSKINHN